MFFNSSAAETYRSSLLDCCSSASHVMPNQSRSNFIASIYSCLERSGSVSSNLRINFPPFCLAIRKLNNAVRRLPICKKPVGDGAKRVMVMTGPLNYAYW